MKEIWFSDVFMGYRSEAFVENGLMIMVLKIGSSMSAFNKSLKRFNPFST